MLGSAYVLKQWRGARSQGSGMGAFQMPEVHEEVPLHRLVGAAGLCLDEQRCADDRVATGRCRMGRPSAREALTLWWLLVAGLWLMVLSVAGRSPVTSLARPPVT